MPAWQTAEHTNARLFRNQEITEHAQYTSQNADDPPWPDPPTLEMQPDASLFMVPWQPSIWWSSFSLQSNRNLGRPHFCNEFTSRWTNFSRTGASVDPPTTCRHDSAIWFHAVLTRARGGGRISNRPRAKVAGRQGFKTHVGMLMNPMNYSLFLHLCPQELRHFWGQKEAQAASSKVDILCSKRKWYYIIWQATLQ